MNDSKAIVSSGWSSLSTIDDFDIGVNKRNINIAAAADDMCKNTARSLFVESLLDQLCKLLVKDPIKRRKMYQGMCRKLHKLRLIESTYNVEELAPLRGFYQQALLEAIASSDNRILTAPSLKFGGSRYAVEFEELCFVSSGGFGKVYKAKNRLDQVIYAVKKIPMKCQSISSFQKKINEVKTLAKLNHPNIVQYKAAWLEPLFDASPSLQSPENTIVSSNDSDIVVFEGSQSHSTNSSLMADQHENDNNLAVCKYSDKGAYQNYTPQVSAILYVTMQLRDETLHEWLHTRNSNKPVDIALALFIMTEAAIGIEYIHSCNIVHHDIKPRNIFLSSDLKSVEVGDFGLSCLQGHDDSSCPLEGGQFGTPLYAAPEQLKGCCDSKSDIFSLGLVFIELLTVFSTEMERVKVLSKARSGETPSSIPGNLVPLIMDLLSRKPSKRPTATELIRRLKSFNSNELRDESTKSTEAATDSGEKSDVSTEVTESVSSTLGVGREKDKIIKDKEREIMELRQMLAEKENEIAILKGLKTNTSF